MSWIEYRARIAKAIADNEQQLEWMKEYDVQTRSRRGNEDWRDTTAEDRQRYEDNILLYRDILKGIDRRISSGE